MVIPLAFGWRHLLFENWPIDPAIVAAHVPEQLSVDTFDGSAWLTVTPFRNVDVRPRGFPSQLGIDLPELNLRTYVTHEGVSGVYFFSLDAQGVASVLGARLMHALPYYYAKISLTGNDGRVEFASHRRHPGARPASYEATYWPTDEPFPAVEDSLAEFLVERYRLYTEGPTGALRYTRVTHEPWTLYPAAADIDTNTLLAASGFETPEVEPVYFYSPGLDVTTSPSQLVSE